MKVLLFGLGSIGQRHARNLRVLRPNAEIVCVDPDDSISLHTDWRAALADHPGADCAIIASPTPAHLDQAIALRVLSIPFYVEKPIGTPDQAEQWTRLDNGLRCAVGYQYRFHSVYNAYADQIRQSGYARFYARDNLIDRYGTDCMGAIANHPIDTALWLLGPARNVMLVDEGVSVYCEIDHERGLSIHDYRIDESPRASWVSAQREGGWWSLEANDQMYIDALSAWLTWVEGGARDSRLAMLADGVQVLNVMKEK